ncbi:MAG: DNA polymerase IV [Pseudomonadota bacterium]
MAPNKFLAKLASDHEKPDGFTVIRSDQVQEFLDPLPVNRLWGVGKASTGTLNRYGIVTVRDLRCRDKSELTDLLGAHGDHLWDLSHGIDSRRVEADHEAKSISQESTFPTDIESTEIAEAHALALTEQVAARCRGAAVKARTLTLKIRFNDFTTVTRSRSTPHGSDSTQEFWNLIKGIIDDNLGSDGPPIRLLGVAASNFEALQSQVSLFDNHVDEKRQSSQSVDRLTDSIQDKFGRKSLKRGTTLLGRKQ